MAESRPPGGVQPPFNWGDFFAFRLMVTPTLIRIVYVIGVVLITVGALSIPLIGTATTVCTGSSEAGAVVCQPIPGALAGGILAGILVFILGQLYFRVVMELLMVIFGIHESVRAIESRGEQ